jgi:hypothetical protein
MQLVDHTGLEVVFDMGLLVVGRVMMDNRQVKVVLLLEQLLALMLGLVSMIELCRPVYLVYRAVEYSKIILTVQSVSLRGVLHLLF